MVGPMPLWPQADNPQDATSSSVAAGPDPADASTVLLCTDLDRTLLPNGRQPLSPGALECFRELSRRTEIRLAYVSGRRLALIEEAIAQYELPVPDFAVADVGTRIVRRSGESWETVALWEDELSRSWGGRSAATLHEFLKDLPDVRLQESSAQGRFKLSYYAPPGRLESLKEKIAGRLEFIQQRAEIVTSVDETTGTGLIDLLPPGASKLHAVQCVARLCGVALKRLVFAGDSGNDLPVLTSGIQSVLVANATNEVVAAARRERSDGLYVATGGFLGMNGNYTAGVLEGLAHFIPETGDWLRDIAARF